MQLKRNGCAVLGWIPPILNNLAKGTSGPPATPLALTEKSKKKKKIFGARILSLNMD